MTSQPDRDELQFDRAETAAPPPAGVGETVPATSANPPAAGGGVTACAACGEPITDYYFEANGKVVCPRCREAVAASQTSGTPVGRFGRAALFGLLATIPGALAWYILERFNIIAALVTIFMGWLVGSAVRRGSNNTGGIAYQILAVVLTYVSIALSQVPEAVGQIMTRRHEFDGPTGLLVVFVVGVFLASPVIIAVGHILNAIIIVFGFYQAWNINKHNPLTFNGPYRLASADSTVQGATVPPPPPPVASA